MVVHKKKKRRGGGAIREALVRYLTNERVGLKIGTLELPLRNLRVAKIVRTKHSRSETAR